MKFFTYLLMALLPGNLAGQFQKNSIVIPEGNTQNQIDSSVFMPGPEKSIFIRAGWVFDGKEMLGGKSVFIRNGIIEAILDPGVPPPPGSEIIDALDCTLMPGLFDGHIHFMGSPGWQTERIDRFGWGKIAEESYSLFPQHRLSLLRNGITSILDMGSPLAGYEHLKKAYREKKILGPEIYYPGPLITAPKGHPAGTIYKGQHDLIVNGTIQVDDETAAREQVHRLMDQKVNFIKIVYDRMWYTPGGAPRLRRALARKNRILYES